MKRRGNLEGSIYQRRDGRWCGQISASGRRVYHYCKTQAEARGWLLQQRQRQAAGEDVSDRSTLAQFLEHWLEVESVSVRPVTIRRYRQVVRDYVVPRLGHLRLSALRADHVQSLYADLLAAGVGVWSVRKCHVVVSGALADGVRWGLLVRNVASLAAPPRAPARDMVTLTADQVGVLLGAVHGTRWHGLYWLAVVAGMRQGELLGLRWSDVDMSAGAVRVQRQAQRLAGGGFEFVEPKSARGRRVIALDPETLSVLYGQWDVVADMRVVAGGGWREHELVFPSDVGTPMDGRNVWTRFRRDLRRCGLPAIRFHDLRHTSATLLLADGVHPRVVQERLGHSKIGITLDTYSHVVPSLQVDAAARIGRRIADSSLTATRAAGRVPGG
jgi:integrase